MFSIILSVVSIGLVVMLATLMLSFGTSAEVDVNSLLMWVIGGVAAFSGLVVGIPFAAELYDKKQQVKVQAGETLKWIAEIRNAIEESLRIAADQALKSRVERVEYHYPHQERVLKDLARKLSYIDSFDVTGTESLVSFRGSVTGHVDWFKENVSDEAFSPVLAAIERMPPSFKSAVRAKNTESQLIPGKPEFLKA
jgi:nitrogen fixation protein FixH